MSFRHAIGAARKDGGLDPWVRLGKCHPATSNSQIFQCVFPPRWASYSPKSVGGLCSCSRENAALISVWQCLKSIFVHIMLRTFKYISKGQANRSVLISIAARTGPFNIINSCKKQTNNVVEEVNATIFIWQSVPTPLDVLVGMASIDSSNLHLIYVLHRVRLIGTHCICIFGQIISHPGCICSTDDDHHHEHDCIVYWHRTLTIYDAAEILLLTGEKADSRSWMTIYFGSTHK